MNENWNYVKLKEVADVLDPHPSHRAPRAVDEGVPFAGIGDISEFGVVDNSKARIVSPEILEEQKEAYCLDNNSIGYGRVGTVGKVIYFGKQHRDFTLSPTMAVINPKSNIVPEFLKAYLPTQDFYVQVNAKMTGTTRPSVGIQQMREMLVPLPDINIQRFIGSTWKSLTDKIWNNLCIIENLFNQIQAIYGHDFDPLTHETNGRLSDICTYSSDRILVSELTNSNYYSTENMLPNKGGAVDATTLPTIPKTTRCHAGDVLISNIRPYFKKIVYVKEECGCSNDVLCFTPKSKKLSAYLLGTLYVDRFFDYMVAGSKGTKMPRGDKQQIMNYPVVMPSEESIDRFNDAVIPMIKEIERCRLENDNLLSLRNTIIPRLISGELEIDNIC